MKLLTVFLLFLASMASEVSGEAKRRKHYTSSSYLDSYQFPDQPRNGYIEEPEESSGESYSDFMDRYYGSSYGGAPNYQIPSLGGGSRFDYQPEGSGRFLTSNSSSKQRNPSCGFQWQKFT